MSNLNILRFLTPKSQVIYLKAEGTARQGLEKMHHHHHNAVPVIDEEGRYVGTVRDGDFLRLFFEMDMPELTELEAVPLSRLIQKINTPVKNSATLEELLERVQENNFVPVIDDRDCFIGIVRRKEILNYFTKEYLEKSAKNDTSPQ